jgi:hypothetical protein
MTERSVGITKEGGVKVLPNKQWFESAQLYQPSIQNHLHNGVCGGSTAGGLAGTAGVSRMKWGAGTYSTSERKCLPVE